MATYGAFFDIDRPEKFGRVHVVIRALIMVFLSILGTALGATSGLLYLAVSIIAAVLISKKGPERYLAESPETMTKWLRYIVAFYAYIFFLTDRLPNENPPIYMRFEVVPSGNPSSGKALFRLLLAIPAALVLALIGILASFVALFAAIAILITETYPESAFRFLRASVRRQARLLAYLAALVEVYPPFAIDMSSTRLDSGTD